MVPGGNSIRVDPKEVWAVMIHRDLSFLPNVVEDVVVVVVLSTS